MRQPLPPSASGKRARQAQGNATCERALNLAYGEVTSNPGELFQLGPLTCKTQIIALPPLRSVLGLKIKLKNYIHKIFSSTWYMKDSFLLGNISGPLSMQPERKQACRPRVRQAGRCLRGLESRQGQPGLLRLLRARAGKAQEGHGCHRGKRM